MTDSYYDDDEPFIIEAYCVRCKTGVEMEHPLAVWTRRGLPATRGECPQCGGVVFRMGRTDLHDERQRPAAIEIGDGKRGKRPKLSRDTVYVAYAEADEELAQQLAADLEKSGIPIWLHEPEGQDKVQWAGGVHPALKECARMVLVLSPAALAAGDVTTSWTFFRDQRKPIIIAQVADMPPPDAIRRSPRFDFAQDYRYSFRQLLSELER